MLAHARWVRVECWPQRSEASTEGVPTAAECQHCPAQRTDGERGGGGGGRAHKLGKAWFGVNWLIYKGLGEILRQNYYVTT